MTNLAPAEWIMPIIMAFLLVQSIALVWLLVQYKLDWKIETNEIERIKLEQEDMIRFICRIANWVMLIENPDIRNDAISEIRKYIKKLGWKEVK